MNKETSYYIFLHIFHNVENISFLFVVETQQFFIDVLEEPYVLSSTAEKRNCDINNATVPYFPAYIVEILCKRSSKSPNVITPSYGRLTTESTAVCEIYGMKNSNTFMVDIYFTSVFNKKKF